MHESLLFPLKSARHRLRRRWETLLRKAPVLSPLASPDVLVHLMDWTLDGFFKTLAGPPNRRRLHLEKESGGAAVETFHCHCGLNPLQTYFQCLEQAVIEIAQKISAADSPFDLSARDVLAAETQLAVRAVSARELKTFCSVCQHTRELRGACGGGSESALGKPPLTSV